MLRAYLLGVKDAFEQGVLNEGRTWSDERLNEAYDRGANLGEFLARARR